MDLRGELSYPRVTRRGACRGAQSRAAAQHAPHPKHQSSLARDTLQERSSYQPHSNNPVIERRVWVTGAFQPRPRHYPEEITV